MTPTSAGGEKQINISGGRYPHLICLRQDGRGAQKKYVMQMYDAHLAVELFCPINLKQHIKTAFVTGLMCCFLLCHSKNKPPAMQGEGRSLDISMSSCAIIEVGLQNHK